MQNFLDSMAWKMIFVIVLISIFLILIGLFVLINPNFLFGYYSPGLLGWCGYWPWFGSGYGGLYGLFGYGGLYPALSYASLWNNPFLFSPFLGGMIWPSWNIYGNPWASPYAQLFGELLLVVPPAGDPIFIDEADTAIVAADALVATISGFLDVPLSPEELIILTDPILNVLAANTSLLPDFWALYPNLAVTNPDLYAAILLL